MNEVEYLFWISLGAIIYANLGYTLVLLMFSRFNRTAKLRSGEERGLPRVSLLISAYNEEAVIEEKILNSLSLNYPRELLEIFIVSDGSDDKTDEITKAYAEKGVRLVRWEGRIGKSACLNRTVPLAGGEIIVFSDANSRYDREAVRHLVSGFADDRVGFVTGRTIYTGEEGDGNVRSAGLYTRLEVLTKRIESRKLACMGADGAVFAIRGNLYQSLRNEDINDLVIPLSIFRRGFGGVLEERAFCIENAARSADEEFRRQMRMAARTLRAILSNADLLNPFRHGLIAFELFSHKVAKLIVPFMVVALFTTTFILAGHRTIYTVAMVGELFFLVLAGIGRVFSRTGFLLGGAVLCYSFLAVNFAIFRGWLKFMRGETFVRWSPTPR